MLTVSEIYKSVQGESSYVGLPCVFIRLTGCHLRCSYCDSEHAFYGGEKKSIEDIIQWVDSFDCPLVELTGGEPLLQKEAKPLVHRLCEKGYRVLIETSGSISIDGLPDQAIVVMDIKCPSSHESGSLLLSNLPLLKYQDEVKFVMADRMDYDWAKNALKTFSLNCPVLFSPVYGVLDPKHLAEWILADKLNVRLQVQLHKIIWGEHAQGV